MLVAALVRLFGCILDNVIIMPSRAQAPEILCKTEPGASIADICERTDADGHLPTCDTMVTAT